MLQVLLVDDESYVVDDLEIAFPWTKYGVEKVYTAYSGIEALQVIERNSIDILITDIAMPGMTGLELISRVKEFNKAIKCILLTGYAEFEYAQEAIKQGVVDYLIKPLDHNKLGLCLEETINIMKEEMEQTASYEQALFTFREHLPVMKDKLLNELLQGKNYSEEALVDKLSSFSLTYGKDDDVFLLVIRLEEHFNRYGQNSLLLFEYAVTNIACELLEDSFETWHCRDAYDYLIFTLKAKQTDGFQNSESLLKELTSRSLQLHRNVNEYLGGGISVILTYPGKFSSDLRHMHENAVTAIRKQVGNGTGYFLALAEQPSQVSYVRSMNVLYDPPTFIHLLETSQWDGFEDRLNQVEEAFSALSEQTEEHLDAISTVLMSSFHYIAHRNNVLLSDVAGNALMYRQTFRSLCQLIEWAKQLALTLKEKLEKDVSSQQQAIIREIQVFISSHLSTVSLQSIADCVSLHPVYVSKLFKQLSGSSLSEYILSVKMEHAVALLRNSTDKVYEISDKLGYSNSQYFIKVFKEQHGMTPQDFRDKT
ncbi:response regulator [Paenibacillus sp. 2TAB26]|uniref:response regulator transcription factor n=1 Tax=Paenibacillus sp. 2TAB26 TaxID=3233005 RepID=UPI003F9BC918